MTRVHVFVTWVTWFLVVSGWVEAILQVKKCFNTDFHSECTLTVLEVAVQSPQKQEGLHLISHQRQTLTLGDKVSHVFPVPRLPLLIPSGMCPFSNKTSLHQHFQILISEVIFLFTAWLKITVTLGAFIRSLWVTMESRSSVSPRKPKHFTGLLRMVPFSFWLTWEEKPGLGGVEATGIWCFLFILLQPLLALLLSTPPSSP